jgi:4-amino-4-deoxy-L-arabinose transferase-like glycosyltransferase
MRFLWPLVAVVALTAAISPFQRDLFVGDETKYGQVVREMHRTGSVVVPTLDGKPFSHKPPLNFWLIYGLTHLFGLYSIWPFVIPSLVALACTIWVVSWASREIAGAGVEAVSAFIFVTFYLAWGLAQTARMDLQFVAAVSAAAVFLYRFLEREGGNRALLGAGAFVGLAILFKGPMAMVIVLFLFGLECFRRRRLPRGNYLVAGILALAPVAVWLAVAIRQGGEVYARDVLITQNLGRAVGSWTHREPPWFYVMHAPGTFFPWFFLGVIAILAGFRRPGGGSQSLRFCVSWMLAVLIPFSIISGKLDVYMLPAMVPLALAIGWFVATEREGRWAALGVRTNVAVIVLLAVLAISAAIALPRFQPDLLPLRGMLVAAAMAALAGLVAIALARDRKLFRSSVVLGLTAVAPLVYLAARLMPFANELASTQPLVRALSRQAASNDEIALFRSPHLWVRDMPVRFEGVRHIGARGIAESGVEPPAVIVAPRNRVQDLGPRLETEYEKVDEVMMIGKGFDVFRRR